MEFFQFFNGFENFIQYRSFYVDSDFMSDTGKVPHFSVEFSVKNLKNRENDPPTISKTAYHRVPKFCTNLGCNKSWRNAKFQLFNLFRFCILEGQKFEILMMTYNSKIFKNFVQTQFWPLFNEFEKLFENIFEQWQVKIPHFGLFGCQSWKKFSAKNLWKVCSMGFPLEPKPLKFFEFFFCRS